MGAKETVSSWLKTLNEKRGESFALDDKCRCEIFYKDGIVCVLEVLEAEGKFYLYSALAPVESDSARMRRALEANLFQIITNGSVLAIDKTSDSYVLSFVGTIEEFDVVKFIDRLCLFLASTTKIRDLLTK